MEQQIEIFFERLQHGEYDHCLILAALESLVNQAWELFCNSQKMV